MSKKLTFKKGLAFGTALAFGSTLIAAAPAMAAPSLSLVPAFGSGYSSLNNYYNDDNDASQIFVFKSNFVDEPMGKEVIYKVENASESTIMYSVQDNAEDAAGEVWDEDDYDYNSDDVFYIAWDPNTDLTSYLALSTWDTDEDVSVKVTAFYDVNENGELDSEEGAADVASAARTLTWYTPENSKPAAALAQPAWADTSLTTAVTFGVAGMNTEMIDEVQDLVEDFMGESYDEQIDVNVERRYPSASFTSLGDAEAEWDSTDKVLYSDYGLGGAVQVATYRSQVEVYDVDNDNTLSAWSNKTVTEPKADYVSMEVVTGANVTDDPDTGGGYDVGVRTGSKSLTFEATAELDGDEVGAGVPVFVTVSEAGLDSTTTITAGGKTLKANGDDIEFTVNTNSSGVASFTVTSSTGEVDDAIDVYAEVDDVDGGITGTGTFDVIWEDTALAGFSETSNEDWNDMPTRGIIEGGSFTLNYLVYDQFDQPTSTDDGDALRMAIVDDGADFDISKSKDVAANGTVSFTVVDDSDGDDTYEVDATLYADQNSTLVDTGYDWTTDIYVNEKASGSEFRDIYLDGYGDGSTDTADLTAAELADTDNYDVTEVYGDVTYEDLDTGTEVAGYDSGDLGNNGGAVYFQAYLADVDGNDQRGTTVTVSAPGLLIMEYNYDYAAMNTLSVPTSDDGGFSVDFMSQKSGVFPVTVTSGTAKITFNVAFYVDVDDVADDEAKLTFSKTATWGKGSIDVKASVTDKFGNGIEGETVDFSKSGLGFLDETSDVTDANGIARVTLVGGTAGSTKVTAESDDSFDAISASSVLRWWSKTASASEGVKAGRVLVYGIAAAGDRVVVRVEGKKVAAYTASGRFSYVVKGIASGDKDVVVRINKKKVFADVLSVN